MGECAGAEFAAALDELKQRSGLSYQVLARRAHFGASTVHRYCSGAALPPEFGAVERLVRACGARPAEVVELHRLWLLADAERNRKPPRTAAAPRATAAPRAVPAPDSTPPDAGPGGGGAGPADAGPADAVPADTGPADAESSRTRPTGRATPSGEPAGGGLSRAVNGAAASETSDNPGRGDERAAADTTWPRRQGIRRRSLLAGVAAVVMVSVLAAGAQRWQGGTGPADGASASAGAEVPVPPAERPPPDVSAGPSDPPASPPEEEQAEPGNSDTAADVTEQRKKPPPAAEQTGPSDPAGPSPGEVPLHWTARSHVWSDGCRHIYLVDSGPESVPAPPVAQDSEAWASGLGAVHGGQAVVEAVLRPAGSYPVVVEAVQVRVTERRAALPWQRYATNYSCGGGLVRAAYEFDLDLAEPQLAPVTGSGPDLGDADPPVLPYQVTSDDPLALRLEARAARCDCSWVVDVEWSSGQTTGTLTLDDGGRPFRTSGAAGDGPYIHVPSRGGWIPESSY